MKPARKLMGQGRALGRSSAAGGGRSAVDKSNCISPSGTLWTGSSMARYPRSRRCASKRVNRASIASALLRSSRNSQIVRASGKLGPEKTPRLPIQAWRHRAATSAGYHDLRRWRHLHQLHVRASRLTGFARDGPKPYLFKKASRPSSSNSSRASVTAFASVRSDFCMVESSRSVFPSARDDASDAAAGIFGVAVPALDEVQMAVENRLPAVRSGADADTEPADREVLRIDVIHAARGRADYRRLHRRGAAAAHHRRGEGGPSRPLKNPPRHATSPMIHRV